MTATLPDAGTITVHVNLGEDRELAFAAKAATLAFNRLSGPIRQALEQAEDDDERQAIIDAITTQLARRFSAAFTLRAGLLE